jgi:hypothetical protein
MAAHHPCSSATSLSPDRRGRLRNGATPGDFLAAPRCGAHTRSGESCRQPAMKNGRCRMHGGLSTGPRTAEGRARCAAARRTHGFYSAEMVALRRAGAAYCRRMDALIASLKIRRTAGHGVLPQNLRNATVGATPAQSAEGRLSRRGRPSGTRRGRPHGAAPTATTAGHGVLPSLSVRPLDSARPSCEPSPRQGFVQRALLGGTALGLGVTVKPPVPDLG